MTKTEEAYAAVRTLIEEGTLPPGSRLVIDALRSKLAMSPTPIREALRLLQAEGLVRHEPYRGMIIADYSLDQALEVYDMRLVLEPMATKRAVLRARPAEFTKIERLHEQLVAAVASHPKDSATLNARWHSAIYAAAHSPLLQESIARLWSALPNEVLWTSGKGAESIAEHRAIVTAIVAKDDERAGSLMWAHIQKGVDRIERLSGARKSESPVTTVHTAVEHV